MNTLRKIPLKRVIHYSVLLIFGIFLFVGGPNLVDSRSFQNLWDLGHIAMFALFMAIIIRDSKWLKSKRIFIQFLWIIFITCFLGALIEVIQLVIGRTYELVDIWRSIIGSLIAFVFFKDYRNTSKVVLNFAKIIVLLLLFIACWPLIKSATDEVQAKVDFPVIADFENIFEIEKWYGQSIVKYNSEFVRNGERSLQIKLLTTKYSGISISYFPKDWQKYLYLKFDVYNPYDNPLKLTCRLHDETHNNHYNDRFNKSFHFYKGWNEISISLNEIANGPEYRKINLMEMKNFALFATNLKKEKTIYFDYLRLE